MKLLKEPLLHFLLLEALPFGAYAWLNRGAGDARPVRQSMAQRCEKHSTPVSPTPGRN